MAGLYGWVGNIVFYLIFITVVTSLLPGKKYERYFKLFAGMVLILLVLKPLTGSLRLEDKIAYYFESITFQNESDDLKKEILGMEQQRLAQMIAGYEDAVAKDVEAMAEAMNFYPMDTRVTIEGNRDSQKFGMVTHIRMTVSRQSKSMEGEKTEEREARPGDQGADSVEPVEKVRQVERISVGDMKEEVEAEAAVIPDENLNRLRRKVEEYYGLERADVEIELAEGER